MKRFLTDSLFEEIDQIPATVLIGARQVGKTTLARFVSTQRTSIYLDLESPSDLAKLTDPEIFFRDNSDKLIILDEIQRVPRSRGVFLGRVPEIFRVLRGIIDHNRFSGKEGGQFLLLGSASLSLLKQTSESLAGRISYVTLGGLNVLETGSENVRKLWLRGGFPNIYLAKSDEIAMRRVANLVRTYLERDIPQWGFRIQTDTLRRLWTMLAHLQGETINFSQLAGNLEVDRKTINFYLEILIDLLLVRRLEPWHSNIKKRIIKSPRFYVRDSGILHHLLGIGDYNMLLSHPVLGKSWEGFVVENICSVLPVLSNVYFYRTASGAEIDLVIVLPGSETWAVEIKFGTAPKIGKYFYQVCDDVDANRKYVVYGGDDEYPVGHDVRVISLSRLMVQLSAYQ